tara:strand:+ start:19348 stop:21147 length:1800 start_codon:yes stop_codon:yes gene_type:complete
MAETHDHTPHDYYTPTGPSDSPDVSGYLSQDSQGSINTFMSETFEADFDYYYTSYDKSRGMEILDRLRTMNAETKAKALDWLIDNGFLHSEEVFNSAYINALGDALYITSEDDYDAEEEEEWPEHECVTCMEGMDELVAKGQSWSCECCGLMVGTEDDHEYCGKNIDGTIVCNHCYDGGHKVTTMITLDGNEVIFNSTCSGEGNEKRFGDREYEITEEYVFGSEEGSAPVQDPMELGEMANWTPLDGSEGLKRKRAESSELSMTLANMERELGIDSEDYEDYEKYTNPTARLNAAISKIEREFGVNEEDYQYRGLKKDAETNKVSAQQIADEIKEAQRKDMETYRGKWDSKTSTTTYARGPVSNKHTKAVYDKYGAAAIMAAHKEMHHKKMNAETTCASCSKVIAEDDIIGDGTNRGLCCVPDYYDAESFSAEYSGPSTLSSALSGARKTGRSGKHLTIVQRLVAKYGIDKGVKIYKHFGIKQKRASPKVRGKVRGTKSGPRRYSEGRVGGAGRSQVYQKGDRTGSWTPSGGHTTRFANSGKAWYQERGLGTPVAGPIPDTDLAGKSMGEKVRGSFVNPHGIVGYPFVPAQQRERKSKK